MITWQRAEISARVLKEILMKWKWRLHGEGFSQGWKSYPGFWNRASIFSPSKRPGKIRKKSMYWKRNVSPGWKGNVSIRNEVYFFQPCWNLSWNRNNISACPTVLKFAILSPSWYCSPLHVDTLFNITKCNINKELNIYFIRFPPFLIRFPLAATIRW